MIFEVGDFYLGRRRNFRVRAGRLNYVDGVASILLARGRTS
jgi:hypothetical protein